MIRPRRSVGERGQATVEVALALPVVCLALLLVIQVALVARSQILVTHAAREGARAAAVSGPGAAAGAAARTPGLQGAVDVRTSGGAPGGTVTVTVRHRARTDVPLVGLLVGDPELSASVTMRVEDELEDWMADPGP